MIRIAQSPSAMNLIIRRAIESDRDSLSSFIATQSLAHRHLDWRTPLHWLGLQPFYLLEEKREILAALAFPPDPPETLWIRYFSVSRKVNIHKAWDVLFNKAIQDTKSLENMGRITAVALHGWFEEVLSTHGFTILQQIVVLERNLRNQPKQELSSTVQIRRMVRSDLGDVQRVDNCSFEPIWRNSASGLSHAFDQSAYPTVAIKDGILIGYQMSTQSLMSAHLARLAVLPEHQRQGVGYLLVQDDINHFRNLGMDLLSVNTQNTNKESLALYQKLGFGLNSESFPVYQLKI
jgi:ribosomal protein S18 acetylase RimI-like enzyme